MISKVLSLRILVAKFALLMAGLAFGGSMGKEGPMVTLSASAMVITLRFILALPKAKEQFATNLNTYARTAIIAGAGAGIAAAFNSITGGIMFAIEEFACDFNFTMGRCLALSVVSSMLTVFGLNTIINTNYENLTFYGTVTDFATTSELFYVSIISGLAGGFLGGVNAQILLWMLEIKAFTTRRFSTATYVWCILCSLALAALHVSFNGITAGEGTEHVISILSSEGAYCNGGDVKWYFFLAKMLGTLLTYLAGICGGVFAPSLSAGAGFGQVIYCELFKDMMTSDGSSQFAVLCSMTAFFGGFTQSPLTSFSILIGMVQIGGEEYNGPITRAAMLTSSTIGSLVAGAVNPTRLYHGMAKIIEVGNEKDLNLGEHKIFRCGDDGDGDDDDEVLFGGEARSSTWGVGNNSTLGAPPSSMTRRSR